MDYKLTINIDEFGQDLEIALNKCKLLDIQQIEIRSLNGKNILDFTEIGLVSLKKKLDNSSIVVSALASPLFKWYFEGSSETIEYDNYYFPKILTH